MNKILLITRPKHDVTVYYLFHWAKKIIELAKSKSISVLDLDEKRANCKEISSVLQKKEPLLVFFNGHGDDGCIMGHDNEILIAVGKNEQLLISKIIYSLSCRSGKKLGFKSVQIGASAYMGYDDDFIFVIDENKLRTPLEDKTAQLFLEPSNQIMISIIKGHTVGNSHERSKKAFKENVLKVAGSESYDNDLIPYLLWDMQHQVCLGNKSSTF